MDNNNHSNNRIGGVRTLPIIESERKDYAKSKDVDRDFGTTHCSTAITHSKVDVRVIGDHPHTGKSGWIPLRNGQPETVNMFGRLMAKIEFPDGTGFYAEMRHFSIYKDQT